MSFIKYAAIAFAVTLVLLVGIGLVSGPAPDSEPEAASSQSGEDLGGDDPDPFGDLPPGTYDDSGLAPGEPPSAWDSLLDNVTDYFSPSDDAPATPLPSKPRADLTGHWEGSYRATSGACAGYGSGWTADLVQRDGSLTGSFRENLVGISGSVSGSQEGDQVDWGVGGGGSGVSFDGTIEGDRISGTFSFPYCPLGGGGVRGDFSGEKQPPPLACAPKSQTLQAAGQDATVTASGGKGTYSWSAAGGTPASGSGPSFTARYDYSGDFGVRVSDGLKEELCGVIVCPPPPPPPSGEGPLPYVRPGCPR